MASKAAKKEARRKFEAEEAQYEKERTAKRKAAMMDASGVPRDVLVDFKPFAKFDRNGLDLELFFTAPEHPSWTPEISKFVFDLTKANMQAIYDGSAWGWKEGKKRGELHSADARYLVARNKADGALVGFVMFQFVMEGAFDVVYIWELQLSAALQRKGVGKHLMQVCELVGRKAGMQMAMLTVLLNNEPALAFYTSKMKYSVDMTSPSMNDEPACYEILSKIIDPAGVAAVEERQARLHAL